MKSNQSATAADARNGDAPADVSGAMGRLNLLGQGSPTDGDANVAGNNQSATAADSFGADDESIPAPGLDMMLALTPYPRDSVHAQAGDPIKLDPNAKLLELVDILNRRPRRGECGRIGCDRAGSSTCTGCRLASFCSASCQQRAWRTHHKRQCSRRYLRDARSECCVRHGAPILSQLMGDIVQLFLEHQAVALESGKVGGVDKVIQLWHTAIPERCTEEEFARWSLVEDSPMAPILAPMIQRANHTEPQRQSARCTVLNLDSDHPDAGMQMSFDWTPQRWLLFSPDKTASGSVMLISLGSVDGIVQVKTVADGVTILEVCAGQMVIPVVRPGGPKVVAAKVPMERKLDTIGGGEGVPTTTITI